MKNGIAWSFVVVAMGMLALGAACARQEQPPAPAAAPAPAPTAEPSAGAPAPAAPAAPVPQLRAMPHPGLANLRPHGMVAGRPHAGMMPMEQAAGAPSPDVKTARELAPEQIGQQATCPVSGESFTVTDATPAVSYQGKVYLFCCAGCPSRFLANPQQYGAPAPAGGT